MTARSSIRVRAGSRRGRDMGLFGSLCLAVILVPVRAADLPSSDAQRIAQEVIQNEVQAEANDHSLWMYRELTKRDGKQLLLEFAQTPEGTIHRLLAVNGEPLNTHERRAEGARIQKLIRSPQAVREAQKKDDADAQKEREFLRLFPQVFRYREQERHGETVELAFYPDPNYRPPGFMAEVLHCLEGTMVLNVKQRRLVSIDGRLTREVKFWGGLLGHVDAGGRFSVTMQNVAPGYWELKSLHVQMQGKILLFKTLSAHENDEYSHYAPMPPHTSLAEAAARLEKNANI